MEVPTPTTQMQIDERKTNRSLFLGITIWFLHQNILYALSSLSCKWTWLNFTVAGIPGVQIVEALISLVALVLIGYMIYIAWQNWRSFQAIRPIENPRMMQDTEKDRRPFVAFIAMSMNAFFFLFILASFVVIFSLNTCVQG